MSKVIKRSAVEPGDISPETGFADGSAIKRAPGVIRSDVAEARSSAQQILERAQVDAFHAAALEAGGTDNGAPGLRGGGYPPGYYAAFVLDPDGNNMEAVFRGG